MNKKIAIVLSTILLLYPSMSKADNDVLSIIQDKMAEIQEKMNTVMEQYTGMQVDMAKLVTDRGAFLGQLRQQAKSLAMNKLMEMAGNIQIGSLSMPGISDKITAGIYVTPELKSALAKQYFKRKKKNIDQFSDAAAEAEKNNNLAVENLAELFAKAVVNRKRLADESDDKDGSNTADESTNATTTTDFVQKYLSISRRANERWISVISFMADTEKQLSSLQAAAAKIDNVADITGDLNDNNTDPTDVAALQNGGMSLLGVYNNAQSMYSNIQSGNYSGAFGDIVNTTTGLTGQENNILGSAVTGFTALEDASRSAEGGNWMGAFDELTHGGSNILSQNGENELSSMVTSGGSLVNNLGGVAGGDYFGSGSNAVDDFTSLLKSGKEYKNKNNPDGETEGQGQDDNNDKTEGQGKDDINGETEGQGQDDNNGKN